MGKTSFHNGVHPDGHKELTCKQAFQTLIPTGDLVFPLSQHIGRPAAPVVKRGDEVKAGQIIAEASAFISANIVSSCSGKVKSVDATSIVITSDGLFTPAEGVGVETDPSKLSKEEIISKVKAAGIVGLGGAGFPTHVKLAPKNPEEIDYVIANGTECEPYITCDDRLMQEKAAEIIGGMKIILSLFPGAKGVVCIEDNKPAAIAAMNNVASGTGIEVMSVPARYPQGGERTVIFNVTGRMLAAGKLPADLGCIVDNVATIAAVYNAVAKNTPLMEKGFTITGDAVVNPGNYIVKIGTPLSQIVEAAGGYKEEPKKLILGGPMMGMAISGTDTPLQKANNALTCMISDPVEEAFNGMTACIRCGKCIKACPVGLYPQLMVRASVKKDLDRYENKLYGLQCMACGSCTYACPAKRPLMEVFKTTKAAIMAEKAKQKEDK